MIFPKTIESKIGFDRVRDMVCEGCSTALSLEMARKMSFTTDRRTILAELQSVNEFKHLKLSGTGPEFTPVSDLRPWLEKIEIAGMYVEARDMLSLARSLKTALGIRRFFSREDVAGQYPRLSELASRIGDVDTIVKDITAVIDDMSQVRDSASKELANIRHELAGLSRRANSAMRRVWQSAVTAGLVDADSAPSVRDGRLVIPVAPSNKRMIPGIVHDLSASGKTVFIEPVEVVELANRQRVLELDERREVIRILVNLADKIRPYLPTLFTTNEILSRYDFLSSKAAFAIMTGGNMPVLTAKGGQEWWQAVHPGLLIALKARDRQVVPLNIKFHAPEARIIVVSGPNAGGKSVVLKTVGINQYMTQCGLLPCMQQGSTVMVMRDIMVDIGDDQSIDNDLSTYSSHLAAMKYFVTHGGDGTLFLADEMGSGTEPQIGGAIAQALLEDFNTKRMWGVVTTHYQNLKTMAEHTPGLINASMLYDRQAMAPLFKLDIGHPGSSFAIEIARKTGLPNKIIEKAGQIVGSDYINLDKYLLDIARDKRYWADKRENVRRLNKDLESKIDRYTQQSDELSHARRTILDEARQEARRIIQDSNAAVERTIREIREAEADREKTRQARARLNEYVSEISSQGAEEDSKIARLPLSKKKNKRDKAKIKQTTEKLTSAPLPTVGDNVKLDGSGQTGQVMEISAGKAMVAFGDMKVSVPLKRLSVCSSPAKPRQVRLSAAVASDDSRQRQLNFKPELDVRGFRADEAIQAITYFIDDAIQFDIRRVRILHGTGTGALRVATREYLRTVPSVKAFHDEDVRFGGAGITVVEL